MESIIFFIIVAVVSSLFKNKEKMVKEQPNKPQRRENIDTRIKDLVEIQKSSVPIQDRNLSSKVNKDPIIENEIKTNKTGIIEKDQIAQGVIWSEILGPPRSKRPHSLKNR